MTTKFYNSGLDYAKKLISGLKNHTITNEYDLVHEAIIQYTGSCEKEFLAQIKKEFNKSRNVPQFMSLDAPRTASGLTFTTLLHEDYKFKNKNINTNEIVCSRCKELKPSACYRVIHQKKQFTYSICGMCYDCEKEYHKERSAKNRAELKDIYIKTLIKFSEIRTGRLVNIDDEIIKKYRESLLKKRDRKRQRNSKRYISKSGNDFLCNMCEKIIPLSHRYRNENRCCSCSKVKQKLRSADTVLKIKKKNRNDNYYKKNRDVILKKKREYNKLHYVKKVKTPKNTNRARDTKWYKKLSPEKYEKYLERKRERMKILRKTESFKKMEYERLKARRNNPIFKQRERERQLIRYYNVEKKTEAMMNSRRAAQKKYKQKVRMRKTGSGCA